MEDGKRPCSKWHQDGIQGKCSTWYKSNSPTTEHQSQRSVATHYENSFGVNAARLWNLLPRQVNSLTALGPFKVSLAKLLERFPDTPPTKGYTAITNNSLLEWNLQKDLNQEWLEDVLVTVVQKQSLPNQPKVPKVSKYLADGYQQPNTCVPC